MAGRNVSCFAEFKGCPGAFDEAIIGFTTIHLCGEVFEVALMAVGGTCGYFDEFTVGVIGIANAIS